jgi:hypothetical protein
VYLIQLLVRCSLNVLPSSSFNPGNPRNKIPEELATKARSSEWKRTSQIVPGRMQRLCCDLAKSLSGIKPTWLPLALTFYRAQVTSAALILFPPIRITGLGPFWDGAMSRYNNLINLALWESRRLWPVIKNPDVVVSIGTGM